MLFINVNLVVFIYYKVRYLFLKKFSCNLYGSGSGIYYNKIADFVDNPDVFFLIYSIYYLLYNYSINLVCECLYTINQ